MNVSYWCCASERVSGTGAGAPGMSVIGAGVSTVSVIGAVLSTVSVIGAGESG